MYKEAVFNFGPLEIVAIAAAVLLIFGPKRLPELAKGLGKGIRDFKKALSSEDEDIKDVSPGQPTNELKSEAPPKQTAKQEASKDEKSS